MNNILLFEYFNPNMELKNDLQNHLSQYPYLSYSLRDDDKNVIITFNKDVNTKYGLGLLEPFEKEVINKFPLKVRITSVKPVDIHDEYKGKVILQNIEEIEFPDLGLVGVEAKCDSGATTSSIHCSKMIINRQNKKITFTPLSNKFEGYTGKSITMPLYSEIKVQNSFGKEEVRPLIKTDVVVKGKSYEIFISLADRSKLDYPVLLGKDILSNFLLQAGL